MTRLARGVIATLVAPAAAAAVLVASAGTASAADYSSTPAAALASPGAGLGSTIIDLARFFYPL